MSSFGEWCKTLELWLGVYEQRIALSVVAAFQQLHTDPDTARNNAHAMLQKSTCMLFQHVMGLPGELRTGKSACDP